MKNPESKIEDYFKAEVIKRGGFTRKYRSPGVRGVPDRIMFWRGVAFVEIKTITGVLSPSQEFEIAKMKAQNVPTFVVSSKIQVDNFLALWERMRIDER
jgi:hypothetical protein